MNFKQDEENNKQKQAFEIERTIDKANRLYQKELSDYLSYIHNLYSNCVINENNKKEELIQLNCLQEALIEENDELRRLIQETDHEIQEIKAEMNLYKKSLNVKTTTEIFPYNVVEFINKKLSGENLAEHHNFAPYAKNENLEAFFNLKVSLI